MDEMQGRVRLKSAEKSGMLQVATCDHIVCNLEKKMPDLIAKAKARKWIRMAKAFINKALECLLDVTSIEDMQTLKYEMEHVDYIITYTNKPSNYRPDDWKFVKMEDMVILVEAVCQQCEFCTKNPQEQKKCKVAKSLSKVTGFDFEAMFPMCRYFNEDA